MKKYAALFATFAVLTSGWILGTGEAQATTPTVPGTAVGFSTGAPLLWESQTDQARDLDGMAATGAKWLRLDFPWPSVQPAATTWNWAPFDRIVSMARARGFSIVGLPSYTPGWAKPSGAVGAAGPANPSTYANFVSALATRYGPQGIKAWEIWNEPNLSWSWNPPSPSVYTAVLKAAYTAIKAVDPTATVISAGLVPAPDDGTQVAPTTFLKAIYANGGKGYFDAAAMHPYSYPYMPTDSSTSAWSAWYKLPILHQTMVDNGDGAKKIWMTEMGVPTGTGTGAVTESKQVDYVNATFTAREQWAAWLGPLFWYSSRDNGTSLADREQNFGLWRYDFSVKPSMSVFASHIGSGTTTTTTAPSTTTTVAPTTTTTVPPTTTSTTTLTTVPPTTTTTTVPPATTTTKKRGRPRR